MEAVRLGVASSALLTAIGLGTLARLLPFINTDFPLNDGALFLQMTRDIQAAGYLIPETTTYNALDIPFVYSPLAFYLAAVLNDFLGVPLLDVFRALPFLFSVATILAFYLVARQLLRLSEAAIAVIAFALLPRSWEWMVLGGGITRSLGFLLALLTIAAAIRMYRTRALRWVLATGVLAGLTALAHPQAAVFMALSLSVLLFATGWSWASFRLLALAGVVGALVIAPWLVPMLIRHGPDPFLSARATGGGSLLGVILFLKLRFTGAPFMDILGIIGFTGLAVALAQRRWLAPVWLALILLVDSRGGATYAMVPLALLIGVAVVAGVRAMGVQFQPDRPFMAVRRYPGLSAAGLTVLVLAIGTNQGTIVKDNSVLLPVSDDQRTAMEWVAANLPPNASVAVVTGLDFWEGDRVSEWFPVLAQRRSVATFQGYEWLGVERWRAQLDAIRDLQACDRRLADCLVAWQAKYNLGASFVMMPKGIVGGPPSAIDCCPSLRSTLRAEGEVVYDGPGATIARMPAR